MIAEADMQIGEMPVSPRQIRLRSASDWVRTYSTSLKDCLLKESTARNSIIRFIMILLIGAIAGIGC